MEKENNLVLPVYRCLNKEVFLCDLIAFVFFMKGQCPSFKEVESKVKLLLPPTMVKSIVKPKSQQMQRVLNLSDLGPTPVKPLQRSTTSFFCYDSPVECKINSKVKAPLSLGSSSSNMFTCYTSPIDCKARPQCVKDPRNHLVPHSKRPMCDFSVVKQDGFHVSFLSNPNDYNSCSLDLSYEVSRTFEHILTSAKKTLSLKCKSKLEPIIHIKQNVHQERMLRCLAEVVPAVLLAAPTCDAIMLAFGQNLLALEQAVLVEFSFIPNLDSAAAPGGDSSESAEGTFTDDEDDAEEAGRQRQLVFSRLLGVSGLAEALPVTSMHVLLRASMATAAPPPPPPFRPRPQFRLRPSCRLTRVTLSCPLGRAAGATNASSTADSLWFHSATPVPGYALSDC